MSATIRGTVYDAFPSIRKFAKAVGWNPTKACDIINGNREPTITDVQEMSVVLGKSVEEIARFFLQKKSQNCD